MLAFLAGCVLHETYGGPGVPENDLAVVQGYWHYLLLYDEEMHIVSVDGRRESGNKGWPYAYSISLPSGKHWLELAVLRNSGELARCAFEWRFEAQTRYKIKALHHDQFLLAHPASSPFAASISMEMAARGKPALLLTVPAVCATSAMCRQDSDCPSNESCRFEPGYDFGTCKPPSSAVDIKPGLINHTSVFQENRKLE